MSHTSLELKQRHVKGPFFNSPSALNATAYRAAGGVASFSFRATLIIIIIIIMLHMEAAHLMKSSSARW